MHELSIALSIIEISADHAEKAAMKSVSKVEIEVGTMAGIETEALMLSLDMASRNTILENAGFEITYIQAQARCRSCQQVFNVENFYDACTQCGSYDKEFFQGKELRVRAITGE